MLGILCGFKAEERIARRMSRLTACSGAREELAKKRASELVAEGATALLSFGVAGGLADGLSPSDVIIGTHVVDAHGNRFECDTDMQNIFKTAAPHARSGGVFGSTCIIDSPAEKNRWLKQTNALIVDMESHVVAEEAARHGMPFAVLRGISDAADAPLPPAVMCGINPDGSTNLFGVLKSLAGDFGQLQGVMHFAGNTERALRQLRRVILNLPQ